MAEPVAIIGIGCRFPGASNPCEFWRLLRAGVDAVGEAPPGRAAAVPGPEARWGGFLPEVDRFDAHFFGISPREATAMDPQQRLLLEVAWEALADAGQPREALAGSDSGVYVGISTNDYMRLAQADPARITAHTNTGNALSVAANRLAYFLDWHGPSLAVDTACSASLVAVHLACRALQDGEAGPVAIAGGVNLILSPENTLGFVRLGALAADGRCKAFDAAADGFVRGEGAGLVVLKLLGAALANGDPIYAVIRGGAVNQDGRSNGLTAPNPGAQQAVVRAACRRAGVSPGAIGYVEAHGTGTLLGDPIEALALGAVLAEDRPPGNKCAIGSVKSNIGHLEAAAGVAGLIKVALALRHGELPPSLHFRTPNPHIPFDRLPLRVQTELGPWPGAGPRLAGVSAFAFGGTNTHLVLVEAPSPTPPARGGDRVSGSQSHGTGQIARDASERLLEAGPLPCAGGAGEGAPRHLLPLSARHPEALRELAAAWRRLLAEGDTPLADLCYTAARRRSHHEHRLALLGQERAELVALLDAFLAGQARPGLWTGRRPPGGAPPADPAADPAALAEAYARGADVPWQALYPAGTCVALPPYPWQRQRYWLDAPDPAPAAGLAPADQPGRRYWEAPIGRDAFPWLDDHQLQGSTVWPAAAYVGLVVAAASRPAGWGLADLALHRPLVLAPGATRRVQVALDGTGFQVYSRDAGPWLLHASGRLEPDPEPAPAVSLAELQDRCPEPLDAGGFYGALRRAGLAYGPAFRGVHRLWRGSGEALAEVVAPAGSPGLRPSPPLLDACLQPLAAVLPEGLPGGGGWLPVAVARVRLLEEPGPQVWSHAQVDVAGPERVLGTVRVYEPDGQLVLTLEGIALQRVGRDEAPPGSVVEGPGWLQAAAPGARVGLLASYLRERVAGVLGIPPEQLDPQVPVDRLGMDSIMAMELKAAVEDELGLDLPVLRLLEGPSLLELAAGMAAGWGGEAAAPLDLRAEVVLDADIYPGSVA